MQRYGDRVTVPAESTLSKRKMKFVVGDSLRADSRRRLST